jgi:hypothetical protein
VWPPSAGAAAGKIPFATAPEDDRGLPDLHLARYDDVVVFDQVRAGPTERFQGAGRGGDVP